MPSPPADALRTVEGCAGPECLDRVAAAVSGLWEAQAEVTDADRLLFETAVVELVGNVVEHAASTAQATVHLGASAQHLWVEVHAPGPEVEVDLDPPLPPDDARSGRGIPLVRRTTHELTLERDDGVNVWRAVRHLGAAAWGW
ncbi:ATP-binding protein [Cellulomonas sp. APG4]|uniref:ATP-binding protein n=1 Tax=Cellulomonas sp. APG4 TaxID=1538656 RepID=UPI00137B6D25|nr:ATP-binding protein [Cellulomonas sp. APG4]NCT90364.1 ATP-binding protein [Cellulomonas sp. APG4]